MGWEEIRQELTSAFGKEASFASNFQKFANLSPKAGQTLQVFLQELTRLARLVSASDKMITAKVLPHLPESLKALVHMYKPQTCRELSELLREHAQITLVRPPPILAPLSIPAPPYPGPERMPNRPYNGPNHFPTRPFQGPRPRTPNHSNSRRTACTRCGYNDCNGIKCPASGASCRSCGKRGHFKRCCRSTQVPVSK